MMRRYLYMVLTLVMAGCAVHQFPEIADELVSPEEPKIVIPLSLRYEPDFYVWEHNYDPVLGSVEEANPSLDLFPDYPGTSSKYANIAPSGFVQVHVKVFSVTEPGRCVVERTFDREINGGYDTDFELELESDDVYDIVVWSHLLPQAGSAPFYDYSDFNRVCIISDNYDGNTDYRDGFRGRIRIDSTSGIDGCYVVRMTRPMGKFELVTTDLSEFLDRETTRRGLSSRAKVEDYSVTISFPMFYPSSYSAMDDRLVDVDSRVSFQTHMTVTGESEASLGFDYVLLSNIADSGVQVRVDVYDLEGRRVAGSAMFTVPMQRDRHTVLRGAFLSIEGNGGVGIDPGFNGDHNVTWQ